MADTVEPVDVSSDGNEPAEQDESPSVTELVVQLGRDLSVLALCEAQLQASRNMPEVRRAARDLAASLLVVVAFAAAFVFANVAAYAGLSTAVSGWVAALGVSLLLALLVRAGHATGWKWWRVFKAGPAEPAKELEKARADAEQAVLDTLEQLTPAITVEIATAAISNAGDMAEGVLDVGEDLLEASDDIVEAIAEDLPAGGVVNQMWDVALMPGRYGLKVVTTVLKREEPRD
jgi:hypothetical protein